MKTKADLDILTPILVELLKNNDHEIGSSYPEQDEDGWSRYEERKSNYLTYEEDGWLIEITYECCGEGDCDYLTPSAGSLDNAWGEVTELGAYHYDETTCEETEFSEDDLKELWIALDKVIEKL